MQEEESVEMIDFISFFNPEKFVLQASNPKLSQEIIGNSDENSFVGAIRIAYQYHLPLELSPDNIWLVVCQGFCQHILNNQEEMRKQFVDFDGKKQLRVQCNQFMIGSKDNDWPGFFEKISDQIIEVVGNKAHQIFVHQFSTTTPLQKTVYEATLLAAMQKYFTYVSCTMCGIPKVRFRGTTQDWKSLRTKISQLAKYDLQWWISKLLPIIDKIVSGAVDGEVDSDFWNSVYKIVQPNWSGSMTKVNGWISNFFPYLYTKRSKQLRDLGQILKTMKEFNPEELNQEYKCMSYGNDQQTYLGKLTQEQKTARKAKFKKAFEYYKSFPALDKLPKGVTYAPFIWKYFDKQFKMKLISGFCGSQLTQDGFIRPRIGWAVGEVLEEQTPIDYCDDEDDEDELGDSQQDDQAQ